MIDYVAENEERGIRAWIVPADNEDNIDDPSVPRPDGWRITIEKIDGTPTDDPIRSTWTETLEAALAQMEYYWPCKPIWRIHQTGEIVDLYEILGFDWNPI